MPHSTIGGIAHPRPLKSFEHYIHNMHNPDDKQADRPGMDSKLVRTAEYR